MADLFSNAPAAGSPLDDLVQTVHTLLAEGGCPWDREQTHESLVKYLLEETYEAIEAIETHDAEGMREELGDVLYQVLFHAQLSANEGGFDIDDMARAVDAKMHHRHPHVFGDATAETAADVTEVWDAAKRAEKQDRTSVLDGIPRALPALALADKMIGRATKIGVLDEQTKNPFPVENEAELGQLLLALVAGARADGLDAERALRSTLHDFGEEIRSAEHDRADAGVIGVAAADADGADGTGAAGTGAAGTGADGTGAAGKISRGADGR